MGSDRGCESRPQSEQSLEGNREVLPRQDDKVYCGEEELGAGTATPCALRACGAMRARPCFAWPRDAGPAGTGADAGAAGWMAEAAPTPVLCMGRTGTMGAA